MRRVAVIILAVVAVISGNFGALAEEGSTPGKVMAYYFHGTFRCPTCNAMERYTSEAIDNNFKDELDSGKLEFKSINIEDAGNEHFVNDYQLYTKTLMLSLVKDGKEVRSKNLDKIWEYVRNKERYINYVKEGIDDFLKEAE